MRKHLIWLAVSGSLCVGYALLCSLTGFGEEVPRRGVSDGQRLKLAGLLADQQRDRSIREKLEAARDSRSWLPEQRREVSGDRAA